MVTRTLSAISLLLSLIWLFTHWFSFHSSATWLYFIVQVYSDPGSVNFELLFLKPFLGWLPIIREMQIGTNSNPDFFGEITFLRTVVGNLSIRESLPESFFLSIPFWLLAGPSIVGAIGSALVQSNASLAPAFDSASLSEGRSPLCSAAAQIKAPVIHLGSE